MRGFWVMWSPDSPGCDAMKTRTEPGNPGARDNVFATTHRYSQIIASGKPLEENIVLRTYWNTLLKSILNRCF
jgi:guanylate kinase